MVENQSGHSKHRLIDGNAKSDERRNGKSQLNSGVNEKGRRTQKSELNVQRR